MSEPLSEERLVECLTILRAAAKTLVSEYGPESADAEFDAIDDLDEDIGRLRAENAAMRETLGECNNEIAQAMLESGHPFATMPVEHARLALVNIAKRITQARTLLAKDSDA
jgi:hypothetical protein